ncbi:MAG: 6-phosphogluconolactonase [Austwickia sp.]|nr:6-phosphogluconolactonase [Austwickia sp.]
MPVTVVLTSDFDHLSEVAADLLVERIQRGVATRARFTLGLATGDTPTGVYKWLAKAANAGEFDASRVTSFNLDEYVGLPGGNAQARVLHPQSYGFFMIQELFGLLRTKFATTHVPWGCLIDQPALIAELAAYPQDWTELGTGRGRSIVIDPGTSSPLLRWVRAEVLDAYRATVDAAGGIDLQIIGAGGRGHVAFHESGIPFGDSGMLLVRLDDTTVADAVADGHFATEADSPRYAISMGAELVYQARTVVLLAHGPRKATPVAASLLEEVSDAVPISFGRRYADAGGELLYVLDTAAAAGLRPHLQELADRGVVIDDRSHQRASRAVAELTFHRDPQHRALG